MKQSAAKTLGVAALGAAFAAAGAGAANAAPAVPDTAQALETVTAALPAEQLSQTLPAGSGEAVGQGQTLAGTGLAAAQPVAGQLLAQGPAGPAAKLLGGLPVQDLPAHGLPVNGVPAV
ncbi:ATP-binding protein [Streptomyces massasporeus]|uniref:ATP-binding protein n=1 Tax=Streptomyces massasporeus TaxID=67324 RepID=UPI0016730239|nr:ATP-binding protein [Streptomyces massasporeus]GGV78258.1 hypothetical protein GCM10010228_46320 [Streptomyces massasporeus]